MDIDIQIAESLIEAFDHEETGILLGIKMISCSIEILIWKNDLSD